MRRSPSRRRSALAIALVLAAPIAACAPGGGAVTRALDPEPRAADATHQVRATLPRVTHRDDGIVLHLEIANDGAPPLVVDPRATLFRLDGLAYSPVDPPAGFSLPTGERTMLDLRFDLGRPLLSPGRLELQGLARDHVPLPALSLAVPSRPGAPAQSGTGP